MNYGNRLYASAYSTRPPTIKTYQDNNINNNLTTKKKLQIRLILTSSTAFDNSFIVRTINKWNHLPNYIASEMNTTGFCDVVLDYLCT